MTLYSRFSQKRTVRNVVLGLFSRDKYERNIESIAKSKAKQNQEKTTEEFIKQLTIKLIQGPKEASKMAFDILCKVLKFSENEIKECEKKIK